jgi:hypothetical protein
MPDVEPPTQQTSAVEQPAGAQAQAAYEPYPPLADDAQWLSDAPELPPRPRRRLLTPVPLALLGVLLTACGFIGGVLVEKGENGSSSAGGATAATFASRLRGLAAGGTSAAGRSAGAAAGGSGAGGFTRPTTGTLAYLAGSTLYVTNSESNTVKVNTSAATSVTKSVKTAVKNIHPGETVTITGSTASNGTVSAESIKVGESGAGGLASLFGASGASGSGTTAGGSSSTSGSAGTQALFGSG